MCPQRTYFSLEVEFRNFQGTTARGVSARRLDWDQVSETLYPEVNYRDRARTIGEVFDAIQTKLITIEQLQRHV